MSLAVHIGQKDLAIFNSFNLHFALLSALQVELGKPLDLIFLCHDSNRSRECRYWKLGETLGTREDKSRYVVQKGWHVV